MEITTGNKHQNTMVSKYLKQNSNSNNVLNSNKNENENKTKILGRTKLKQKYFIIYTDKWLDDHK